MTNFKLTINYVIDNWIKTEMEIEKKCNVFLPLGQ